MEKDMRYFFCNDSDSDIKAIQDGQIEKLIDKSNIIHFLYIDVNNSIKDYLLEKLNFWSLEVDEEEYVMFVPSNNILLEKPNEKEINSIVKICKESGLDYCKLRKTSVRSKARGEGIVFKDESNIFFSCPYIIKYKVLKEIISRYNMTDNFMFWKSLETTGFNGIYYYDKKKDLRVDYSYIVPSIFHTISDVITDDRKWSSSYVNSNKNILNTLTSEYNINIEERGIDGYAFSEECCKQ